jgi:hypothetical protein
MVFLGSLDGILAFEVVIFLSISRIIDGFVKINFLKLKSLNLFAPSSWILFLKLS